MTDMEKRAIELRDKKFGVNSLQWEPATRDNVNPIATETPMTDRWYKEGLTKMREKWGIDGQFACEGELGARLRDRTLGDALASDANARMRHSQIKTSTASYQGKPVKMFVEIVR